MMQQELSNVPLTQAALALDEFVEQSYERVQQMLNAGVPWREILTRLATAGENLAGHGASVSILILDENGLLRNGASPADDKWAELRHLPLALGFVGAWSMPITSSEGKVLGTFGTYFRDRRSPTPKEKGVGFLAKAAAAVLAQV